jgi:hypothetical protein
VPASPDVIEGMSTFFANPDKYPVDSRGIAYTLGFFSAKHIVAGQFYLLTFTDKDGHHMDGGSIYRLNVPANAPVTQYWSASVYDSETHALVRYMQWASRSSQTPGLQKKPDGSVDVYFGPKAPSRERLELGSHKRRSKIRGLVPPLWAGKAPVRQNLEAARHREVQLKTRQLI